MEMEGQDLAISSICCSRLFPTEINQLTLLILARAIVGTLSKA